MTTETYQDLTFEKKVQKRPARPKLLKLTEVTMPHRNRKKTKLKVKERSQSNVRDRFYDDPAYTDDISHLAIPLRRNSGPDKMESSGSFSKRKSSKEPLNTQSHGKSRSAADPPPPTLYSKDSIAGGGGGGGRGHSSSSDNGLHEYDKIKHGKNLDVSHAKMEPSPKKREKRDRSAKQKRNLSLDNNLSNSLRRSLERSEPTLKMTSMDRKVAKQQQKSSVQRQNASESWNSCIAVTSDSSKATENDESFSGSGRKESKMQIGRKFLRGEIGIKSFNYYLLKEGLKSSKKFVEKKRNSLTWGSESKKLQSRSEENIYEEIFFVDKSSDNDDHQKKHPYDDCELCMQQCDKKNCEYCFQGKSKSKKHYFGSLGRHDKHPVYSDARKSEIIDDLAPSIPMNAHILEFQSYNPNNPGVFKIETTPVAFTSDYNPISSFKPISSATTIMETNLKQISNYAPPSLQSQYPQPYTPQSMSGYQVPSIQQQQQQAQLITQQLQQQQLRRLREGRQMAQMPSAARGTTKSSSSSDSLHHKYATRTEQGGTVPITTMDPYEYGHRLVYGSIGRIGNGNGLQSAQVIYQEPKIYKSDSKASILSEYSVRSESSNRNFRCGEVSDSSLGDSMFSYSTQQKKYFGSSESCRFGFECRRCSLDGEKCSFSDTCRYECRNCDCSSSYFSSDFDDLNYNNPHRRSLNVGSANATHGGNQRSSYEYFNDSFDVKQSKYAQDFFKHVNDVKRSIYQAELQSSSNAMIGHSSDPFAPIPTSKPSEYKKSMSAEMHSRHEKPIYHYPGEVFGGKNNSGGSPFKSSTISHYASTQIFAPSSSTAYTGSTARNKDTGDYKYKGGVKDYRTIPGVISKSLDEHDNPMSSSLKRSAKSKYPEYNDRNLNDLEDKYKSLAKTVDKKLLYAQPYRKTKADPDNGGYERPLPAGGAIPKLPANESPTSQHRHSQQYSSCNVKSSDYESSSLSRQSVVMKYVEPKPPASYERSVSPRKQTRSSDRSSKSSKDGKIYQKSNIRSSGETARYLEKSQKEGQRRTKSLEKCLDQTPSEERSYDRSTSKASDDRPISKSKSDKKEKSYKDSSATPSKHKKSTSKLPKGSKSLNDDLKDDYDEVFYDAKDGDTMVRSSSTRKSLKAVSPPCVPPTSPINASNTDLNKSESPEGKIKVSGDIYQSPVSLSKNRSYKQEQRSESDPNGQRATARISPQKTIATKIAASSIETKSAVPVEPNKSKSNGKLNTALAMSRPTEHPSGHEAAKICTTTKSLEPDSHTSLQQHMQPKPIDMPSDSLMEVQSDAAGHDSVVSAESKPEQSGGLNKDDNAANDAASNNKSDSTVIERNVDKQNKSATSSPPLAQVKLANETIPKEIVSSNNVTSNIMQSPHHTLQPNEPPPDESKNFNSPSTSPQKSETEKANTNFAATSDTNLSHDTKQAHENPATENSVSDTKFFDATSFDSTVVPVIITDDASNILTDSTVAAVNRIAIDDADIAAAAACITTQTTTTTTTTATIQSCADEEISLTKTSTVIGTALNRDQQPQQQQQQQQQHNTDSQSSVQKENRTNNLIGAPGGDFSTLHQDTSELSTDESHFTKTSTAKSSNDFSSTDKIDISDLPLPALPPKKRRSKSRSSRDANLNYSQQQQQQKQFASSFDNLLDPKQLFIARRRESLEISARTFNEKLEARKMYFHNMGHTRQHQPTATSAAQSKPKYLFGEKYYAATGGNPNHMMGGGGPNFKSKTNQVHGSVLNDEIYLNKSGWVQVNTKRLHDENYYAHQNGIGPAGNNTVPHFKNTVRVIQIDNAGREKQPVYSVPKITGSKIEELISRNEARRNNSQLQRTGYLKPGCKIVDPHLATILNERPGFLPVKTFIETESPPPITPILSPPPAFQDTKSKYRNERQSSINSSLNKQVYHPTVMTVHHQPLRSNGNAGGVGVVGMAGGGIPNGSSKGMVFSRSFEYETRKPQSDYAEVFSKSFDSNLSEAKQPPVSIMGAMHRDRSPNFSTLTGNSPNYLTKKESNSKSNLSTQQSRDNSPKYQQVGYLNPTMQQQHPPTALSKNLVIQQHAKDLPPFISGSSSATRKLLEKPKTYSFDRNGRSRRAQFTRYNQTATMPVSRFRSFDQNINARLNSCDSGARSDLSNDELDNEEENSSEFLTANYQAQTNFGRQQKQRSLTPDKYDSQGSQCSLRKQRSLTPENRSLTPEERRKKGSQASLSSRQNSSSRSNTLERKPKYEDKSLSASRSSSTSSSYSGGEHNDLMATHRRSTIRNAKAPEEYRIRRSRSLQLTERSPNRQILRNGNHQSINIVRSSQHQQQQQQRNSNFPPTIRPSQIITDPMNPNATIISISRSNAAVVARSHNNDNIDKSRSFDFDYKVSGVGPGGVIVSSSVNSINQHIAAAGGRLDFDKSRSFDEDYREKSNNLVKQYLTSEIVPGGGSTGVLGNLLKSVAANRSAGGSGSSSSCGGGLGGGSSSQQHLQTSPQNYGTRLCDHELTYDMLRRKLDRSPIMDFSGRVISGGGGPDYDIPQSMINRETINAGGNSELNFTSDRIYDHGNLTKAQQKRLNHSPSDSLYSIDRLHSSRDSITPDSSEDRLRSEYGSVIYRQQSQRLSGADRSNSAGGALGSGGGGGPGGISSTTIASRGSCCNNMNCSSSSNNSIATQHCNTKTAAKTTCDLYPNCGNNASVPNIYATNNKSSKPQGNKVGGGGVGNKSSPNSGGVKHQRSKSNKYNMSTRSAHRNAAGAATQQRNSRQYSHGSNTTNNNNNENQTYDNNNYEGGKYVATSASVNDLLQINSDDEQLYMNISRKNMTNRLRKPYASAQLYYNSSGGMSAGDTSHKNPPRRNSSDDKRKIFRELNNRINTSITLHISEDQPAYSPPSKGKSSAPSGNTNNNNIMNSSSSSNNNTRTKPSPKLNKKLSPATPPPARNTTSNADAGHPNRETKLVSPKGNADRRKVLEPLRTKPPLQFNYNVAGGITPTGSGGHGVKCSSTGNSPKYFKSDFKYSPTSIAAAASTIIFFGDREMPVTRDSTPISSITSSPTAIPLTAQKQQYYGNGGGGGSTNTGGSAIITAGLNGSGGGCAVGANLRNSFFEYDSGAQSLEYSGYGTGKSTMRFAGRPKTKLMDSNIHQFGRKRSISLPNIYLDTKFSSPALTAASIAEERDRFIPPSIPLNRYRAISSPSLNESSALEPGTHKGGSSADAPVSPYTTTISVNGCNQNGVFYKFRKTFEHFKQCPTASIPSVTALSRKNSGVSKFYCSSNPAEDKTNTISVPTITTTCIDATTNASMNSGGSGNTTSSGGSFKCRFGASIWRNSKERRKTKFNRRDKCNSGDSGIQIEGDENFISHANDDEFDDDRPNDGDDDDEDFELDSTPLSNSTNMRRSNSARSTTGGKISGGNTKLNGSESFRIPITKRNQMYQQSTNIISSSSAKSKAMKKIQNADAAAATSNGTNQQQNQAAVCSPKPKRSFSHPSIDQMTKYADDSDTDSIQSHPDDRQPIFAEVLNQFQPAGPQELALEPGALVEIIRQDEGPWWYGKIKHDEIIEKILEPQQGWFPKDFVRVLNPFANAELDKQLSTTTNATNDLAGVDYNNTINSQCCDINKVSSCADNDHHHHHNNVNNLDALSSSSSTSSSSSSTTSSNRIEIETSAASKLNEIKQNHKNQLDNEIEHMQLQQQQQHEQQNPSLTSSNSISSQQSQQTLLDKLGNNCPDTASQQQSSATKSATIATCEIAAEHYQQQMQQQKSLVFNINENLRQNAVKELIETEINYVNLLSTLCLGYLKEMQKRIDIFPPDSLKTIFSNIEIVWEFQKTFLEALRKGVEANSISQTFINHQNGFAVYSTYCNSYPRALMELENYSNSKEAKCIFENIRVAQKLSHLPLSAHLLAPIQRICRYPLHLAEIVKHTPSKSDLEASQSQLYSSSVSQSHPVDSPLPHCDSKEHIETALNVMKKVTENVNEGKRHSENLNRFQSSFENFQGPPIACHSTRFFMQTDATRISPNLWNNTYTLFLFDHQLIYCKKDILKRNHYMYKGRIFLDNCRILNLPDGKIFGVSLKNALRIYCETLNKWFDFCFRSSSRKLRFLSTLAIERQFCGTNLFVSELVGGGGHDTNEDDNLSDREYHSDYDTPTHNSESNLNSLNWKQNIFNGGQQIGGGGGGHCDDQMIEKYYETLPKKSKKFKKHGGISSSFGLNSYHQQYGMQMCRSGSGGSQTMNSRNSSNSTTNSGSSNGSLGRRKLGSWFRKSKSTNTTPNQSPTHTSTNLNNALEHMNNAANTMILHHTSSSPALDGGVGVGAIIAGGNLIHDTCKSVINISTEAN